MNWARPITWYDVPKSLPQKAEKMSSPPKNEEDRQLKDNSTMDKTKAQIVSYGILYLNPSSHQCQPSYKKYISV